MPVFSKSKLAHFEISLSLLTFQKLLMLLAIDTKSLKYPGRPGLMHHIILVLYSRYLYRFILTELSLLFH